MIYSIHVTSQAEHDMDNAANYIASTLLNPTAAYNLLVSANDILNSLEYNPERNHLAKISIPTYTTKKEPKLLFCKKKTVLRHIAHILCATILTRWQIHPFSVTRQRDDYILQIIP